MNDEQALLPVYTALYVLCRLKTCDHGLSCYMLRMLWDTVRRLPTVSDTTSWCVITIERRPLCYFIRFKHALETRALLTAEWSLAFWRGEAIDIEDVYSEYKEYMRRR